MGYKHDQNFFSETYRPSTSPDQESQPEQLEHPPLLPSGLNTPSSNSFSRPPPSYAESASGCSSQSLSAPWAFHDPRSSSTQSLLPTEPGNGKRNLLLIYIHGFLGNDESFHSFPAHVHNIVVQSLAETHVVHTKIYPRYKSRKVIEYSRNEFSNWLRPHESSNTDVILLGHSMGGLLSAEVVLMKSSIPGNHGYRHRIIGTINFDCPFFGMHPGVVVSGIGSLFRPAPEASPSQSVDALGRSQGSKPSTSSSTNVQPSNNSSGSKTNGAPTASISMDSDSFSQQVPSISSSSQDPNFNPAFHNDIRIPVRRGWESALHFVTKHSNDLSTATKAVVSSHLEFGGCVVDYKGLRNRYARLRELEDIDPHQSSNRPRIRFVNYYTASSGRVKKQKLVSSKDQAAHETMSAINEASSSELPKPCTLTPGLILLSPQIPAEQERDMETRFGTSQNLDEQATIANGQPLAIEEPMPLNGDIATLSPPSTEEATAATSVQIRDMNEHLLPPLPELPQEPPQFDPGEYSDKDVRRLAQKEHSRQAKNYARAVKAQEKAIKSRQKLADKKSKLAHKELQKSSKSDQKPRKPTTNPTFQNHTPPTPLKLPLTPPLTPAAAATKTPETPKRDKKFCMHPARVTGQDDRCWIRVFMPGVDEVDAHCGLLVEGGDHYTWLVVDVAGRIKRWVNAGGGPLES